MRFLLLALVLAVASALHMRAKPKAVATGAPEPAYCAPIRDGLLRPDCGVLDDCLGFRCKHLDPALLPLSMAAEVRYEPCFDPLSAVLTLNNTAVTPPVMKRWRFNTTVPNHFFPVDSLPVTVPNFGNGTVWATINVRAGSAPKTMSSVVQLRVCQPTGPGTRRCYAPAFVQLLNATVDFSTVTCKNDAAVKLF